MLQASWSVSKYSMHSIGYHDCAPINYVVVYMNWFSMQWRQAAIYSFNVCCSSVFCM